VIDFLYNGRITAAKSCDETNNYNYNRAKV